MDNTILKQLIKDQGLQLYDTETICDDDEMIFRIYITHKDGITLDHCTQITHIVSPILDIDPPINGEYILEVSSPGTDRKLTKLIHFKNSIDELVKVKLSSGDKLKCKIVDVKDKIITFYDKKLKKEFDSNFDEIVKAKTYLEW